MRPPTGSTQSLLGDGRNVEINWLQKIQSFAEPGGSGFGSCDNACQSPACARTFEARSGDLFASAFDCAAADQISLLSKAGVVDSFFVVGVIGDSFFDKWSSVSMTQERATCLNYFLNTTLPKISSCLGKPFLGLTCICAKYSFCNGSEVLTGMIPIHNLDGLREIFFDQPPNPNGSIRYKNDFIVCVDIVLYSCCSKQPAKLFRFRDVAIIFHVFGVRMVLLANGLTMMFFRRRPAAFLHLIPTQGLQFTPLMP